MRISTSMLYRQGTSAITQLQSELAQTQIQLASGNRLLSPSDDPVGASRLLEINAALEQTVQYQRNANMARNRLGMEEQVLSDVENVLFRIRDLTIQANNDTLDSETRGYIAAEATEALEQLVQLANTQDATGNYLFAGFSSQAQPFQQSGTSVSYSGDQGRREIQISNSRFVVDSDPGADIFMQINNGSGAFRASASAANTGSAVLGSRTLNDVTQWDNGNYTVAFTASDAYTVTDGSGAVVSSGNYSSGDSINVQGVSLVISGSPETGDSFTLGPAQQQDMFSTVQNFVDALNTTDNVAGIARLHNQLGNVLEDLDRSIDNVLDFRTRVGTRLQTIETQEVSNEDFSITLESSRAELQQLDYAEAVSRLSQQLAGLEAAQQSFVRIQGLSLFNLI